MDFHELDCGAGSTLAQIIDAGDDHHLPIIAEHKDFGPIRIIAGLHIMVTDAAIT